MQSFSELKSRGISARCVTGVALSVTAGLLWALPTQAQSTRTVALTGDDAPGLVATPFNSFSGDLFIGVGLNDAGQVAFAAGLDGPVAFGSTLGIWSEGSGTLSLLATTGDVAPGTGGDTYTMTYFPTLHNNGTTVYVSLLAGGNFGFFTENAGVTTIVAHAGDPAPGAGAGVVFEFPGLSLMNDSGQIAFSGVLTGTGVVEGNNQGVWSNSSGSMQLLYRKGDLAPGAGGGVFTEAAVDSFNANGQIAVFGFTDDLVASSGIWNDASGSLAPVALRGDATPGVAGVFGGFNSFSFNDNGQTAFSADIFTSIDAGGVPSGYLGFGAWSDRSGTLSLILREGDDAIGVGPGVLFGVPSTPLLNANGQIAFTAKLSGAVTTADDSGIWSDATGSIRLLVREGDAAAGTGVAFGDFGNSEFALNGNGDVAFLGTLVGLGITEGVNDTGLWAQDSAGVLQLIARTGDLFDVDDSAGTDLRQIVAIDFMGQTNGESGLPIGFNDANQVAFWLGFSDNSEGIFVSTVPEPSSLALLSLGGLLIARRRRA